ncbi:protein arginine methyltransferase NDUFAF7 homolog, mitochondrial [Pieris napi]|uniref:protein arginine methyltransferase NDUFAF7 homolog, mitochondrial n=1 Tax=Pieris napi TaxID=78633 RepID=UPI001FBB5C63|nr:protein arginine methyltransferase NDUFAF7 homolog, mitochondrial [Pieris napi]
MNYRNICRLFDKRVVLSSICKRTKGYVVVKRPDPKTLKMPTSTEAPSILDIIKEKVRLNGPITVAEYMHIVITNPTEGYYMKKDVIGQQGDFVTSPEISQLFGEILTIWFFSETRKMGPGKPLQIVELGPGNGTLMIDVLRVLNRLKYKPNEFSIHLVEISSTMQLLQANKLCASHKESDIELPYNREGVTVSGIKVYWYNDLKKVPQNFSWYIAHEFFDVLPVHKFEKTEKGWREILIDLDENQKLYYRISAEETPSVKMLIRPPLNGGDRMDLEISPRALGIGRQLAQRVDEFGGLALIADYGHEGEKGDTFRAFHQHKLVDPLENPGVSDLTADVDFSQLRVAASMTPGNDNYAIVLGPVKQKDFLERMQAKVRLEVLLTNIKNEEDKEKLMAAYNMLVDPQKMGDRFKFMAFYPSSMGEILEKHPPVGFANLDARSE